MWEILLILLVILVVFGPRRLPELGGALGIDVSVHRPLS
jgi:TatA/E family protein of Tat protein translocase